MNKQEVIETIKNIDTLNIDDMIAGQQVDMVIKNQVLDIITQIDEPEKPVVPQFVADWIESHKETFSDASAIDMYENLTLDNKNGYYHDVWLWAIGNHHDFIKAWYEGYEVEKEKLYTVKLKANDQVLSKHYGTIGFVQSSIALSQSYIQFSKSDLEQAGFGWVFDCDGVKVVEVE